MGPYVRHDDVAVPLPACTDYLKAFTAAASPGGGRSRCPRPVSGLDARVGEAALASAEWAAESRRGLGADADWLETTLIRAGEDLVRERVAVHTRCVLTAEPAEPAEPAERAALAAAFARHGVGVRVLGPAHGVHPGAVRILAPRPHERAAVTQALARVRVPAGRA